MRHPQLVNLFLPVWLSVAATVVAGCDPKETAGTPDGGAATGTGGAMAGTGGAMAGTGGAMAGTGGAMAGTGGTGGTMAGTGGATGGATGGTGGATGGTGGTITGTGGAMTGTGGMAGSPADGGAGNDGGPATGGTVGTPGDAAPPTDGPPGTGYVPPAGPLVMEVAMASDSSAPKGRLLYTITVGNVSTRAVDGVTVLMRIPANLQFNRVIDAEPDPGCAYSACTPSVEAKWTLGTMVAGTSRRITVNAQVLATAGEGDAVVAPFQVSATGINSLNLTRTATVRAAPAAQMTMGAPRNLIVPNETFTLDLAVGQIGAAPLAGTELRLFLPAGLTASAVGDGGNQPAPGEVVWPIGGVPVGASLRRKVTLKADAGVTAGATFTPRATLKFDGGAEVDLAAEYTLAAVATESPLRVDVSLSSVSAVPGGRTLYTVTVGNTAARALDDAYVVLRIPAGAQFNRVIDAEPDPGCAYSACTAEVEATWSLGTMPAGSSRTIVANLALIPTVLGDGSVVLISTDAGATSVNEINVTRTLRIFAHPAAELALASSADPVLPGQAFSYDIDLGQIGAAALSATELRVFLPAGLTAGTISDGGTMASPREIVWSIGGVAVGGVLHRKVDVTAGATLVPGTPLDARAELTFDGGNAIDLGSERAASVAPAAPPLTLEVASSPALAPPGGRLMYTITVSNVSARAIDLVGVQLRLPPLVSFNRVIDAEPDPGCAYSACTPEVEAGWALGTLAAGMTRTITVNALIAATRLEGSLIVAPFTLTATGMTNPINRLVVVPAHK